MACVHGTATGGLTFATLLTGDQQASPEVLPPSVDTPAVERWLRHSLLSRAQHCAAKTVLGTSRVRAATLFQSL